MGVWMRQKQFYHNYTCLPWACGLLCFDINVPSNLTEMVPVFWKAGTMPRACIRHSGCYITSGSCRLIKSDAKLMSFPDRIYTVMLESLSWPSLLIFVLISPLAIKNQASITTLNLYLQYSSVIFRIRMDVQISNASINRDARKKDGRIRCSNLI